MSLLPPATRSCLSSMRPARRSSAGASRRSVERIRSAGKKERRACRVDCALSVRLRLTPVSSSPVLYGHRRKPPVATRDSACSRGISSFRRSAGSALPRLERSPCRRRPPRSASDISRASLLTVCAPTALRSCQRCRPAHRATSLLPAPGTGPPYPTSGPPVPGHESAVPAGTPAGHSAPQDS